MAAGEVLEVHLLAVVVMVLGSVLIGVIEVLPIAVAS